MSRKLIIILIIVAVIIISAASVFFLGRIFTNKPQSINQQIKDGVAKEAPLVLVSEESEIDFYNNLFNRDKSPNNNRKALLQKESSGIVLKIIDLKTNKTLQAENINLEDVNVAWVQPDEIFFIEKPSSTVKSSAWSYNLKSKAFNYLFQNEPGLMVNWSKNGNLVLKFNGALSLINNQTAQVTNLPFITLPHKCAFSDNNKTKIYCAIPRIIPSNITLPDDYLKNKFYSQDQIVSLSINPIKIEIIFDSESESSNLDGVNPVIIGDYLYLKNRYDNKTYKIKLL